MDVSGKVALVTGGGRGIGRAIATVLAKNGADLAVADINSEDAAGVASEIEEMERGAIATSLDVTEQASVDKMVADVLERLGRIDILVNNAGVVGAPGWEQREALNEEDWDLVFSVNLKGVARVANAVSPHMKQRRYGKIVNIASVAGRLGSPTSQSYSASKAGVINLTQTLALELAPFGINVNAICPGLLWTPMWKRIATHRLGLPGAVEGMTEREEFDQAVEDRIPLGREQTPEDVGHAVAFLASDYARNITGQALNVSGGSHLN